VSIVYVDLETTHLSPQVGDVWEIAWAVDDGPITHGVVPHTLIGADQKALEVGGYAERAGSPDKTLMPRLRSDLAGNTLAGANPAFDVGFLRARWPHLPDPFKYRLLDIEAYAMGAFGWDEPKGLRDIAAELRGQGWDIPAPDHTAAGDVRAVRACHGALRQLYGAGIRQQATS
jgi:DNA polymerase-3 subunit epsilon